MSARRHADGGQSLSPPVCIIITVRLLSRPSSTCVVRDLCELSKGSWKAYQLKVRELGCFQRPSVGEVPGPTAQQSAADSHALSSRATDGNF